MLLLDVCLISKGVLVKPCSTRRAYHARVYLIIREAATVTSLRVVEVVVVVTAVSETTRNLKLQSLHKLILQVSVELCVLVQCVVVSIVEVHVWIETIVVCTIYVVVSCILEQ